MLPDPVVLEKINVGIKRWINNESVDTFFGRNIKGSVHDDDFMADRVLLKFTSQVLGHRLPAVTETQSTSILFRFPATPWQHFKRDHADSWWLRWFVAWRPVVLKGHRQHVELSVNMERHHVFPEATINAPELGPVVFYGSYSHDWREM